MRKKIITARVFRFNAEIDDEPRYQVFEIENEGSFPVFELVRYIHQNIDQTLGYRNYYCNIGRCMSCLLNIDGKNTRGCTKMVNPGDTVTIAPAKGYKVIRDLVVDFRLKTEM